MAAPKRSRKPSTKTTAKPVTEDTVETQPLTSEDEAISESVVKEANDASEAKVEVASETVTEDNTTVPDEPDVQQQGVTEVTPVTPSLDTLNAVEAFLVEPGMTINEKLEVIAKNAHPTVKGVTAVLLGYLKDGSAASANQGEEYTLGLIYNLYVTIKSVIEAEDRNVFRINMDIISLVIMNNNKHGEAFNELRLLRYDYLWSWGEASLRTHQVIMTIMCHLANKADRVEALKRMDLGSEALQTRTELAPEHVARFVQYYS